MPLAALLIVLSATRRSSGPTAAFSCSPGPWAFKPGKSTCELHVPQAEARRLADGRAEASPSTRAAGLLPFVACDCCPR